MAQTIILTWTSSLLLVLVFPNCVRLCGSSPLRLPAPPPSRPRPSLCPEKQHLPAMSLDPDLLAYHRRYQQQERVGGVSFPTASGFSVAIVVGLGPSVVTVWQPLSPAPGSHWALGSPLLCLAPSGPGVEMAAHCIWSWGLNMASWPCPLLFIPLH